MSDQVLSSLLGCDDRATLQFFFQYLNDDMRGHPQLTEYDALSAASILATFASTSRYSSAPSGTEDINLPPPVSLAEFFDRFIADTSIRNDYKMMKWAGSVVLLLNGFLRGQSARRHNVDWYDCLGADFFDLAARNCRTGERKTLGRFAEFFSDFAQSFHRVSRQLRQEAEEIYVIKVQPPEPPLIWH